MIVALVQIPLGSPPFAAHDRSQADRARRRVDRRDDARRRRRQARAVHRRHALAQADRLRLGHVSCAPPPIAASCSAASQVDETAGTLTIVRGFYRQPLRSTRTDDRAHRRRGRARRPRPPARPRARRPAPASDPRLPLDPGRAVPPLGGRSAAAGCDSQRPRPAPPRNLAIVLGTRRARTVLHPPRDAVLPRRLAPPAARGLPLVGRPQPDDARGSNGDSPRDRLHARSRRSATSTCARRPARRRTRSSSSTPAAARSRSTRATSASTSKPFDATGDFDAATQTFTLHADGLAPSKYSFLFRLATADGTALRPLWVPMWIGAGVKYAGLHLARREHLPDLHRPLPRRRSDEQHQQRRWRPRARQRLRAASGKAATSRASRRSSATATSSRWASTRSGSARRSSTRTTRSPRCARRHARATRAITRITRSRPATPPPITSATRRRSSPRSAPRTISTS